MHSDNSMLKKAYMIRLFALALVVAILASCRSPSKKHDQDMKRRVNELQNVGTGAIEGQLNEKGADSIKTDTTSAH
jgi:hypothetical protein